MLLELPDLAAALLGRGPGLFVHKQFGFFPTRHVDVVHKDSVGCARAVQDTGHGVVVHGGHGIELVVVTAGAAQGQAHDATADDVDLLVGNVEVHLGLVALGQHLRGDHEETGGDQLPVTLPGRIVRQQVTGNLFANELVVGHVRVEGVDDVVAVSP